MVRDLINILMGSPKNIKIAKTIWWFLKYMELNVISKDLMDEVLKLFVVMYLKSASSIKVALQEDLENVFVYLKDKETKIIVDRVFKYQLMFPQISQFRHCLKFYEQEPEKPMCEILARTAASRVSKSRSSVELTYNAFKKCLAHGGVDLTGDQRGQVLNLSSKVRFISVVCFLA